MRRVVSDEACLAFLEEVEPHVLVWRVVALVVVAIAATIMRVQGEKAAIARPDTDHERELHAVPGCSVLVFRDLRAGQRTKGIP